VAEAFKIACKPAARYQRQQICQTAELWWPQDFPA
jgi:hypothetical protein